MARKRSRFGAALGDVLQEGGQTVTGLVREHLATAFQQAGHQVVGEGSAEALAAWVVDVRVKKFWVWFQPGLRAITLSANIETDLELASRSGRPTNVSVRVDDSRQLTTDGAWMEVIDKALAAYRAQVTARLSGPPF